MYIDDIAIDTALTTGGFEKDTFSYYPNPVTDVLHLSADENITSVAVYTVLGQEVITKSASNLSEIDMSALPKGTYLAKITSGKVIRNVKVIKS